MALEGTRVKFAFSVGKEYIADVAKMSQVNVVSGHRRRIRREESDFGSAWYYDASVSGRPPLNPQGGAAARGARWALYPPALQPLLDRAWSAAEAHRRLPDGGNSSLQADSLLCVAQDPPSSGLSPQEMHGACEAALARDVPLATAFRTVRELIYRHGLRCTAQDARRAALCSSSMAILQLVLRSNPDLQLLGVDIFDRRYTGITISGNNRLKNCIKALLARGALLGQSSCTPSSKLLRKVEADTQAEWARRYLHSAELAGLELPDHVQARILAFLPLPQGD